MRRRSKKVYRDGRVHVMAERCDTCIFRPGNLMSLRPGCVKGMVAAASRKESSITCHETLAGAQAVCRGFFDLYPTAPLQIARRLGYIEFVR